MKLQIRTEKPIELVEAFDKLTDGIERHGRGQITTSYLQTKSNEFVLDLFYPMENRMTDWVIVREIKNTLRKLDPKIDITKVSG